MKKTLINSFILLFLITSKALCQCGDGESIILSTQTQVDSFLENHCKDFFGVLRIQDDNDGIDNIQSLSSLTGLRLVDRVFSIQHNNFLQNLIGLDSLEFVGALRLLGNPNLTSLEGLNQFEETRGDFWIFDHPNLENLDALTSFTQMGFGGSLKLSILPKIQNINGLAELDLFSSIAISDCDQLTDISVLDDSIIFNYLQNSNNYSIVVAGNNNLSDCSNPFLCKFLNNENIMTKVEDNLNQCNTIEEVLMNCTVSTIDTDGAKSSISVYPNPNNGYITIENSANKFYSLYRPNGELVSKGRIFSSKEKLEIKGLVGYYVLDIEGFIIKILKTE